MPFVSPHPLADLNPLFANIDRAYRMDESAAVLALLDSLQFDQTIEKKIEALARQFVEHVRKQNADKGGIEALMMHYDLSTEEGILLMCLAEALLRIPDKQTEQLLIQDKLTSAAWDKHIGLSESSFVNASTWGLALTGKILSAPQKAGSFRKIWKGLIKRGGEPFIRQAVREAIKVMSRTFVIGRSIDEALKESTKQAKEGYVFSYDMLGEAARTLADADRYMQAYEKAIVAIGDAVSGVNKAIFKRSSISIKLSALYPRYDIGQEEKAVQALTERLTHLARIAKQKEISITVDAEEADRLLMSLTIFENVFANPEFAGWPGLGLAIQAYQKRAYAVIEYIIALSQQHKKIIPVRLVKGAYWDSEIKVSQVGGFDDYPVFTRKINTDVSYLACAKLLLTAQETIYPQFATHNAYTVAAIIQMMGDDVDKMSFEFQHLHGMGQDLHRLIVRKEFMDLPCRIYAPVGSHEDLLPYLVRRLLENGANSSFVNQIADDSVPIEKLTDSPVEAVRRLDHIAHDRIPKPADIYGKTRKNSHGLDFSQYEKAQQCQEQMNPFENTTWCAGVAGDSPIVIKSPANQQDEVGYVQEVAVDQLPAMLEKAQQAFPAWNALAVSKRADILFKIADLMEAHQAELMAICTREAGKTLPDGVAEIREAVDFCRYYAVQAKKIMRAQTLPGPTGESNTFRLHGRGTILCISPWNFPVAIFAGQVVAALVTGNTVIAKPAEQTPLSAQRVIQLMHEAGVPEAVLQCAPGQGETIGHALVADERIAGVMFTGSTAAAKAIQLTLAQRKGAIVPLIAETGGLNAMIADSSALPEQLVMDVVQSAFGSAGQRCSALRVLFIQEEVADKVIAMLAGAMRELEVNHPQYLSSDVGPVIDQAALTMLQNHAQKMDREAKLIHRVRLPSDLPAGNYFAPCAYELPDFALLDREVFGPILHVVRFARKELPKVVDAINAKGYGLTFGIQSRINNTVDELESRINVGNIYVNRNMIGAVVGVQPFGGSGLSGTGPKAGGPYYLLRLCEECTLSIDTTAAGGNASLMAMSDEE